MSAYLLMNRDQLAKSLEKLVEDYFNSTYVAVAGGEHPISDFLDSVDSEYSPRDLAKHIAEHITEDFLERMRYSFMPNLIGKGSCKECGRIYGQWMSRYSGTAISENDLKGMHIIVPL